MKLLLNSGFIDFYVDKKSFENCKKEIQQKKLVFKRLEKIFIEVTGKLIGDISIRDISIISNEFWGNDLHMINDIGFNISNQLPKNEEQVCLRYFGVNIVSVIYGSLKNKNLFLKIEGDGYLIQSSNYKIV